jgi:hypothetical protein
MLQLLHGSLTIKALALALPLTAMVLAAGALRAPEAAARHPEGTMPNPEAAAPNPEEAGVRAALEAYLQGHATGQADAFRRAFHPDTRMLFNRDGKFTKVEIVDYIARAPGKPAEDEAQRKRSIDLIDITGDAAIARLTLDYPDAKLTDYMTLLKIDGEWRIVAKVFTADRRPAAERKSS